LARTAQNYLTRLESDPKWDGQGMALVEDADGDQEEED
jgi:hypothetical protein